MTITVMSMVLTFLAGAGDYSVGVIELASSSVVVARPAGVATDARTPVLIALHGTDTNADEIVEFWSSMEWRLPFSIVAPQSKGRGWSDADQPLLREVSEYVSESMAYDSDRLLLAGHSAGGAMVLHWVYGDGVAVVAVAATACYVPPTVSAESAARRSGVPLFYAVGEEDVNRPRLRAGVKRLQQGGVHVRVYTPDVGHVLDRDVGLRIVRWFENVCRQRVELVLSRARSRGTSERSNGPLKRIVENRDCHLADHVRRARKLLGEGGRSTSKSESGEKTSEDFPMRRPRLRQKGLDR